MASKWYVLLAILSAVLFVATGSGWAFGCIVVSLLMAVCKADALYPVPRIRQVYYRRKADV